MSNTPSQQPLDGDTSEAADSGTGVSFLGRLRAGVCAAVEGARRRLSVLSDLDLTPAFRAEQNGADVFGRPTRDDQSDQNLPVHRDDETAVALPDRDTPLIEPARDADSENGPDLEADEEEDRLSIYHPDHDGAEITSDTWMPVER